MTFFEGTCELCNDTYFDTNENMVKLYLVYHVRIEHDDIAKLLSTELVLPDRRLWIY